MRIFNSLIVPKNLIEGTLWDFFNIRSVAKNQNKLKRGPFEDITKIFEKEVSQSRKKGGVSYCRKSENLLLRNTCKKLAHTHGLRVVARKKKHPPFPITLAYRKCNK